MTSALTPHQHAVVDQVVQEEEARRRHLVVSISGAHAYGFPSPDSDVDIKSIHIMPTRGLLGFTPPRDHAERLEVIQGVEVDYSSNELQQALQGILAGNGNFVERVLGSLRMMASPELVELRPLVQRSLSTRLHRHYRGFATSQLKQFEESSTAKKVLYVLRTALTGTHVLLTGELIPDLTAVMDEHGFPGARELVARKLAGEKVLLPALEAAHWKAEALRALDLLDNAMERSVLPSEPPNALELEEWLIQVRLRRI